MRISISEERQVLKLVTFGSMQTAQLLQEMASMSLQLLLILAIKKAALITVMTCSLACPTRQWILVSMQAPS
jgi:hypothetical protein